MTKKEYCTRCATTGVENDLRFDNTGSMVMVEGYDKLYQTIAKICLTRVNSNPYHSWYGTNAFDLIGNKLQSATEMSLRDSVSKAITKIVDVQNQLEKLQSLTLEERISRVRRITVEPLDQDQTTYLVTVEVVSRANTSVNINIVFAVPGSFDITGA
jgi:phage baseplate assembly protein W